MATKSKLELLMVLSDKLFNNKLSQVQAKLSGATDKMDAKLNKFSGNQVKIAAGVAGAFAAIGGFALITSGLNKSIEATEKFDTAFLPIKQLNLDKSKSEISSYRNLIRDSAYIVGTSLEASTQGFYDLQSATGLYGKDAAEVFKTVGRYSIATGANLTDSINSTTKAMKAFGIGVIGIDALLTSNAKTVQVGITTFDELARVQTEYAGATSAAGQSVDTGNKIFAMFTSISKNADIAANMTKTFFDGLGQQTKQIKDSLNINVFDTKGNMKDADKLLIEISNKFKNMSDKQITEVINKIGGPEGLRGALAKVKTGAEDMINTFNAFDSSTFNLSDALKNAEGDYGKMKELFGNRMEMVFSKMGEKVLPILAGIFDKMNPMLDWLYKNVDWLIPAIGSFASVLGVLTAGVWLFNVAMAANPVGLIVLGIAALIGLITAIIVKWDEWGAALSIFMGPIGIVIGAFKSIYDHWESIKNAFKTDGILGGLKRIGMVLLDVLLKPLQQILETVAEFDPTGWAQKGADSLKAFRESNDLVTPGETNTEALAAKSPLDANNPLAKAPVAGGKNAMSAGTKKQGEQVSKVAGQANQVRKIEIKIDSFNKGGINVAQSAYAGMTKEDIEAWFKEMLRRVIINAETA
ncbi:MAG TPA: phage tail tape measure protein [Flavobacterium sp.]|jgi:TP901 family phage tail tape measure protein